MNKAIVVGATSGLGFEIANLLVKNGYKVGGTGRRKSRLEALQTKIPASFVISSFDCTAEDNEVKLNDLMKELGGLDLLILSSGTGYLNKSLDYKIEHKTNLLNVNAFTQIVNWAFHIFLNQGFGHLVAISSIAGIRGGSASPAYNASKAYQINYLEGLRQKVMKIKKPIYITDVRPGFVDTDMAKGEGLFWVAKKEKAAKQIFGIIKNKKAVGYVTRRWWLIGKFLMLIPRKIYSRL